MTAILHPKIPGISNKTENNLRFVMSIENETLPLVAFSPTKLDNTAQKLVRRFT